MESSGMGLNCYLHMQKLLYLRLQLSLARYSTCQLGPRSQASLLCVHALHIELDAGEEKWREKAWINFTRDPCCDYVKLGM